MTDDFYLASVPEPVTLLGLRLRPLSLGHIILLHRVDSAFVKSGIPDYDDLAISVLICSLTYSEGVELFNDTNLHGFMRRWHDRLTGASSLTCKLGLRKPKLIDLAEKSQRFFEYIQSAFVVPHYSYSPSNFSSMDCPEVQCVKVRLMRDMHLTEAEMMDRSWRLCLWDYITLKAIAGEVKMHDRGDIELAMSAGKELAEAIAEGRFKMN